MISLKTSDIGIAIKDHLQDVIIEAYEWEDNEIIHMPIANFEVDYVDIADPHNPLIHVNNEIFKLTITKVG